MESLENVVVISCCRSSTDSDNSIKENSQLAMPACTSTKVEGVIESLEWTRTFPPTNDFTKKIYVTSQEMEGDSGAG